MLTIEKQDIDIAEENCIKKFIQEGCGCTRQCSSLFSEEHYLTVRAQCQELEHDLALMGYIMGFTNVTETIDGNISHRYRQEPRQRERRSNQFFHYGQKVCI